MLARRLTTVFVLAMLLHACGDSSSPSPELAGVWLLCVDDRCEDTHEVGWLLPPDQGAIQRVEVHDGRVCTVPAPLFEGSSWSEAPDGALILVTGGSGSFRAERKGDFLPSLSDGVIYDDELDAALMTRVASSAGPC